MTAALVGVGGHSTPRPHLIPGKEPVPILQEAEWDPGPVWTGGKSRPTGMLYNQHTFIQIHCVHSSTFVTATVSIVSEVSVHRTRDIITPHSTVPFDPLLSLVHLAHISLPPHFTLHKSARLTHFEAHIQQ